jgi:hypothetical protein
MSKPTDKTLFIDSSWPRFYQHLLKGIASFEELGNRVINQIKAAHAFRDVERVRELSRMLVNIPIKEYQLIAQYYLVWCQCRELKLHTNVLENIADQSRTYKTKALLSLAGFEGLKGNVDSELYLYVEALKSSCNISDYVQSSMGIAVVKAKEGFHESALKDLEKLIVSIKHAEPIIYFDVLNSYAVELGESGHKNEARNVSRIVLASPFAHAYPEWKETAQDLKEPSRSFVSVPSIEPEPVEIEAIEAHHVSEPDQPATILAFPQLKEAPQPQKPDRLSPQEISELTTSEKRELILAAIRTGTFTQFDYDRFMLMVGLLRNDPVDKVLDLEDEETISDIAVVWANQVEPEQFAAVMSAIRDCEDRNRQRDIIDKMIRIAFQETQLCGLTEEAWRLQFERRLPKK